MVDGISLEDGEISVGGGIAFFATGPGLGLIMYILTILEFPTHNFDFHLLTI